MIVFNLAIFATFDNDIYSVQVPKTLQKEGIRSYVGHPISSDNGLISQKLF